MVHFKDNLVSAAFFLHFKFYFVDQNGEMCDQSLTNNKAIERIVTLKELSDYYN